MLPGYLILPISGLPFVFKDWIVHRFRSACGRPFDFHLRRERSYDVFYARNICFVRLMRIVVRIESFGFSLSLFEGNIIFQEGSPQVLFELVLEHTVVDGVLELLVEYPEFTEEGG